MDKRTNTRYKNRDLGLFIDPIYNIFIKILQIKIFLIISKNEKKVNHDFFIKIFYHI
jgi:hypothetical protein